MVSERQRNSCWSLGHVSESGCENFRLKGGGACPGGGFCCGADGKKAPWQIQEGNMKKAELHGKLGLRNFQEAMGTV